VIQYDREAELAALSRRNLDGANLIIAKMWIYHKDLEHQCKEYAEAKTYNARIKSTLIVSIMADQTKPSATAAEHQAEADPEVWRSALAYRLSEQMVAADREALKILHAELDKYRTEAADQRAADAFMTRNQP
jgi:hypothetical protein